jgi:hypothetical protein
VRRRGGPAFRPFSARYWLARANHRPPRPARQAPRGGRSATGAPGPRPRGKAAAIWRPDQETPARLLPGARPDRRDTARRPHSRAAGGSTAAGSGIEQRRFSAARIAERRHPPGAVGGIEDRPARAPGRADRRRRQNRHGGFEHGRPRTVRVSVSITSVRGHARRRRRVHTMDRPLPFDSIAIAPARPTGRLPSVAAAARERPVLIGDLFITAA